MISRVLSLLFDIMREVLVMWVDSGLSSLEFAFQRYEEASEDRDANQSF